MYYIHPLCPENIIYIIYIGPILTAVVIRVDNADGLERNSVIVLTKQYIVYELVRIALLF